MKINALPLSKCSFVYVSLCGGGLISIAILAIRDLDVTHLPCVLPAFAATGRWPPCCSGTGRSHTRSPLTDLYVRSIKDNGFIGGRQYSSGTARYLSPTRINDYLPDFGV